MVDIEDEGEQDVGGGGEELDGGGGGGGEELDGGGGGGERELPPPPEGIVIAGRFPSEMYSEMTTEEINEKLTDLESRWRIGSIATLTDAFETVVSRVFDLNSVVPVPSMEQRYSMLEDRCKCLVSEISALTNALSSRWRESADMRANMVRGLRMLELAYHAHDAAHSLARMHGIARPEGSIGDEDDFLRFGMVRPSLELVPEGLTDYAKLVLFTIVTAYRSGLQKSGDSVYRRIVSPDGYRTQAFERYMSIAEYITHVTNPMYHADIYSIIISRRSIVTDVAKTIAEGRDYRLPTLRRVRNIWSFPNGTYIGSEMKFFGNEEEHPWKTYVATRYIDTPFDPAIMDMTPEDIPTPYVETILDSQGFDPEVKLWAYILIFGRIQYEITEMDDWEVAAFLKGVGASGKSTLLHQAARMFDPSDIGVIGSNEDKFVTASLVNKNLVVCYEASKSIGMNQMDFQSSQSGEEMSIRGMNKEAITRKWRCPILLAGNMSPGWTDNSGSFARRIALFHFTKRPQANPRLKRDLVMDLPNLIHKANAFYRGTVDCLANDADGNPRAVPIDIWDAMPETFRMNRENLAKESNPLEGFLSGGTIIRGDDKYIDLELFIEKYNTYCKAHKRRGANAGAEWSEDLYKPIFDNHGIKVVRESRFDPNKGDTVVANYVVGLTFYGYEAKAPPNADANANANAHY